MAPKPENIVSDLTDLLGTTAKSVYTTAENSWLAWSGRKRGTTTQQDLVAQIGRQTGGLAMELSGAGDVYRYIDDPSKKNATALSINAAASIAVPAGIGYGIKKIAPVASRVLVRLAPEADLSSYVFHGGPTPDKLVGGVIDPDYVRGGTLQNSPTKINQPSVAEGINPYERQSIMQQWENANKILTQKTDLEAMKTANKFVNEHREIVRRIQAGEEHFTAVTRLDPGMAYSHEGGTYLLKVPKELMTQRTPAPPGEVKVWGKQKPVDFIPYMQPGNVSTAGAQGRVNLIQALIDHADANVNQTLRMRVAKAAGLKVTPAYKQYLVDAFDLVFSGNYKPITQQNLCQC
jgi:hypothetical protein